MSIGPVTLSSRPSSILERMPSTQPPPEWWEKWFFFGLALAIVLCGTPLGAFVLRTPAITIIPAVIVLGVAAIRAAHRLINRNRKRSHGLDG